MTTKAKKLASKTLEINDVLLKNTEKTILKSFDAIQKTQSFADQNFKKGLKKSEELQNKFFDGLENGKGFIWKKLNRTLDFIGVK